MGLWEQYTQYHRDQQTKDFAVNFEKTIEGSHYKEACNRRKIYPRGLWDQINAAPSLAEQI